MLLTKKQTADLSREIATIIVINDSPCTPHGAHSSFSSPRWETEGYKWISDYIALGYTIEEIVRAMQEIESHWFACDCLTRPGGIYKKTIYAADIIAVLRDMRTHGYYECPALQPAGRIRDDEVLGEVGRASAHG